MFAQSIHFLGNGDGLSGNHNNAWFCPSPNEIVLVDCSMVHFSKFKALISETIDDGDDIKLVITHMHDDHVSALGLLTQFCYYAKGVKLNVLAPSALIDDIYSEMKIKGVPPTLFNLFVAEDARQPWLEKVIPTSHTPQLEGKCFGYVFRIADKKIVYTGDTCTLNPFVEELETADQAYIDCSVDYGTVHILYDDVETQLDDLAQRCDVYLMHVDNEQKLQGRISGKHGIAIPYVDAL